MLLVRTHVPRCRDYGLRGSTMSEKVLMKGNEALAESAMRAGCQLLLRLSHYAPDRAGRLHVQAHAQDRRHLSCRPRARSRPSTWSTAPAAAGARAMTSSSSPGISLKSEGVSYMAGADLPGVIINVHAWRSGSRFHPALPVRLLAGYQGHSATATSRWSSTHPRTVQEMADYTYKAFDMADEYRMPVMILADGMLGQMMEPVELPEPIDPQTCPSSPWACTRTQ